MVALAAVPYGKQALAYPLQGAFTDTTPESCGKSIPPAQKIHDGPALIQPGLDLS